MDARDAVRRGIDNSANSTSQNADVASAVDPTDYPRRPPSKKRPKATAKPRKTIRSTRATGRPPRNITTAERDEIARKAINGDIIAAVTTAANSTLRKEAIQLRARQRLTEMFGDPETGMRVVRSGQPSSYSPEAAAVIATDLAAGMTMRQAAADIGITRETAYSWRASFPEFADMITRARGLQAENMADEIVDIADDSTNDWVVRETNAGRIRRAVDQEHVQRSRLRVDARLKLMEKFSPDKFGQRHQLTGKDGAPLFNRLQRMSEAERYAEAAALVEQARRRLEMDALARGGVSDAEYVEASAPMAEEDDPVSSNT